MKGNNNVLANGERRETTKTNFSCIYATPYDILGGDATRIISLVVKYLPSKQMSWVRFPDDAFLGLGIIWG